MRPDASPIAPSSIDFARSARIRASSSCEGARSSAPITQDRRVPWPTNEQTLIAGLTRSTASAYSPKDDQVRCTLRRESSRSSSASARPLTGADEPPQFPQTTSVTPICNALSSASFTNIASSECEWMSMKPGATMRSFASMTRAVVVDLVVPDALGATVDVGAARRELPHRTAALGVHALPLVDEAAVKANDDLRIRLEHIDRDPTARREMLAHASEARPAVVGIEHEERVEGDEDEEIGR